MSATTEQVLAAQRGPQALAGFCEQHAGLVHECVWRFLRRVGNADRTPGGLEREDLAQVAWIGFLKAVRGFDASRGCEFSTYAVPTMLGMLSRAHRIANPGGVHLFQRDYDAGLRADTTSLDAPVAVEEGASPLGELLPCTGDLADEAAGRVDAAILMRGLTAEQRATLTLVVFGGRTQESAATVLGISQAQVSRRLRKAVVGVAAALGRPAPAPSRKPWNGGQVGRVAS